MMSALISLLLLGFICATQAGVLPSEERLVRCDSAVPRGMSQSAYSRQIREFWSPERIASAKPLDLDVIPDVTHTHFDLPVAREDTTERLLAPPTPPKLVRSNVGPRRAGKIFFMMGGLTYMCSGSVVTAKNRDTILTAGHCVYNSTSKETAKNLVFIPYYLRGDRPHGTFPARCIKAASGWISKVDYNNDVALVLVDTNDDGVHVLDEVGGFGISLGANVSASTHLFGYPVITEKGEVMDGCAGSTTNPAAALNLLFGFKGLSITCHMNGGSSGGPWLRSYDKNTGNGVQVSVTSFGSSLAAGKIQGPLFSAANIGNLYDTFQNQ